MKKFTGIVAVIVVVVGCTLFFLHRLLSAPGTADRAGDIPRDMKELYVKADDCAAKGQPDEALAWYEKVIMQFPSRPEKDRALLAVANRYYEKDDILYAKKLYQLLLADCPESPLVTEAQQRLGNANIKILFLPVPTGDSLIYEVQKGDTLGEIAKKYKTTVDLIKKSNGLASDLIRIGQRLKITTLTFTVSVDKSDNTLTLKGNGETIKVYRVATGTNNSTPVGVFTITTKLENPTWYTAQAIIPAGSAENILGTRWMGLSAKGYGIHGTTHPESIGQQATAGCVRMVNDEVEELYLILPRGTEVTITD